MFDTHCHLNFKAFKKTLPDVISRAHSAGITDIVIPGTDVKTSKKAVELAQANEKMYAAVGIHPHHAYKLLKNDQITVESELALIETLLQEKKVVAVGEIGMDRHEYEETVYGDYAVNEQFIEIQKELLKKQIDLAKKYKKSLIFHNREAKNDLLPIVREQWDSSFEGHSVFHCCEPDQDIFAFAKEHNMFIGVDGDITYYPEKQEFIQSVPLEMLVLETDSPFLLPEPLKTERKYPNEPKNIELFVTHIAELMKIDVETLKMQTTKNAYRLFNL